MRVSSIQILRFWCRLVGGLWLGVVRADPVSEALADPGKFVIEAEDFDFGGGQHVASASVMPYYGGHYQALGGILGVDFLREPVPEAGDYYRTDEQPNVPIFEQNALPRRDRGTWTANQNYSLGYAEPGQWFNYTRNLQRGGYRVWAAASFGDRSEGGIRGRLQKVIGGAGTTNQAVEDLGFFEAPGSGSWETLSLVPLQTAFGNNWADLGSYGKPTTLRYVPISGDVDYLLFQFVTFIDEFPPWSLQPVLESGGQVVLIFHQGWGGYRALQGATELKGDQTEWHDIPNAQWRYPVPAGSPYMYFRLDLD